MIAFSHVHLNLSVKCQQTSTLILEALSAHSLQTFPQPTEATGGHYQNQFQIKILRKED